MWIYYQLQYTAELVTLGIKVIEHKSRTQIFSDMKELNTFDSLSFPQEAGGSEGGAAPEKPRSESKTRSSWILEKSQVHPSEEIQHRDHNCSGHVETKRQKTPECSAPGK